MDIKLTIGVWIIFVLLCLYVFFSGKERKLENYTSLVRKSWYLIFIFGFLMFLTIYDVDTLFTNWKEYLIVLVVFVIIDSLLFLELHFTKLGGQELNSAKVQVSVTQKELDTVHRKLELIPIVLTSYEFVMYNLDKRLYVT